ncbi:MAG: VWA domain-containing protein [Myxococcota bacterium]
MVRWFACLLVLAFGCDPSGGGGPSRGDGGMDADIAPARDADGDGIGDDWEGRDLGTDTDGDGTPDFRDEDSDGDGIRDADERVSGGGDRPPLDSDGDGTPDFQDTDADGNGIPDEVEGTADSDGDALPDYRDLDNDGDTVRDVDEIGDDPSAPLDFDGDGLPDYLDIDSDDDTISDRSEFVPPDTDGDGIIDRHDLDTDADGYSDMEEAGDSDLATSPVDTDLDGIPDFRDPDSDNDGLSDAAERDLGTARDNADTDGDGVTDLIETSACDGDPSCADDATNPASSPRTRGDFVFFEPFMAPPDPLRDTLDFSTDLRIADVYFLIDTTGSMGGPIANVRSSLSMAGGIIDQVRAEIADVWIGVGEYRDFGDGRIYNHIQDMSASAPAAQAAVNGLRASGGGDGPEGAIPALWSLATGMAVGGAGGYPARGGCPAGTIGYACFRSGAVPIAVVIADAPFHNGPGMLSSYSGYTVGGSPMNYTRALPDILAANMRIVGVPVGSGSQSQLTTMAADTGAPTPVVATGGTVNSAVVDQIRTLANSTRFDISAEFIDDPSDTVDTFAAFVDRLEANEAGDAGRGCDPRAATDTNGDSVKETFPDVPSGNRVCFDIVVKQNDMVMPTTEPQVFRATIRVLGDGFTELDSRDVFFLVPPTISIPDGPD